MDKADLSLDEAIAREKGVYCLKVLRFTKVMKQLLDSAKTDPSFSAASWGPLAEFVDTPTFERVGTFKETVRWPQYTQLLTDWSKLTDWRPRVRRVTERGRLVFMELAETANYGGPADENIFSLTTYAFGEDGKLRHLDVYMQREPAPLPEGTWDTAKA